MATDQPDTIKDQALHLLLQNLQQDTFNTSSSRGEEAEVMKSTTWTFSTPCSSMTQVQESTSTLMAALAFAKSDHVDLAWQSLLALFEGQHEDGFLPKYRYGSKVMKDEKHLYYIENTTIPGPYIGSYLAAIPLHASIVLEVFSFTLQTDEDVLILKSLYESILKYHKWIMNNDQNFLHPWETLWSTTSWIDPLKGVRLEIKKEKWEMPFQVPIAIKESYDYIEDVYEPCIYLLQKCRKKENTTFATNYSCSNLYRSVERTAILVKAHEDFQRMREVLLGRHMTVEIEPQKWLKLSRDLLFQELWNENYQTFLPRRQQITSNITTNNIIDDWIIEPDASAFVGLWAEAENTSRVYNMASKLIQRNGDESFFFDCGLYAVWSVGGCVPDSSISPFLNYLISKGLYRNDVRGIAWDISNLTTKSLLAGDDNNFAVEFAEAMNARSGKPFPSMDSCPLTSTATAAVAYDLSTGFSPLPPFLTDPPIQKSSVIALVIFELVVAFSIGASCLLLSLRLLRQEFQQSDEEHQSFILEDGFLDDGYFSLTNSVDANNMDDTRS